MSVIDSIQISGVTYTIQGGGNPTVELTQAQYDALVTAGTVQADTYYIITDAQAGDLTNYYTKTETNTLLGGKQNTLVSGTNIKTINNESILGSGNISVEGKGVVGNGSISVSTGATDYTINFTPSIWAGSGTNAIKENYSSNTASGSYSHAEGRNTMATGSYSHAEGRYTTATGSYSHAEGYYTTASTYYAHAEGQNTIASGQSSHAEGYNTSATGSYSHAEGRFTTAQNEAEHASGRYNVSSKANTTFGDSGNTLFSVGNGDDSENKHNVLDIRQNGDIYIADTSASGDYFLKPMIKLQDYLGGVDTALNSGSTNPVENQALWDELRIPKNEEVETVLEWENHDGGATTNYPTGASKLEFYIDENEMTEGYFFFQDDGYNELGKIFIEISNGNISVTDYENVTYTISGDVVTVNYSSIAASVALIYSSYDCNWTVKAYTSGIVYEPIIDQVTANTTALGGLKLVKLTQTEYNALSPNYDSNTLYVIVN